MSFCMIILTKKFSIIFLVKIVIKNHVLNLMNFLNEMVNLFFHQEDALKKENIKQIKDYFIELNTKLCKALVTL